MRAKSQAVDHPVAVDVLDVAAIFATQRALAKTQNSSVRMNYGALGHRCDAARSKLGLDPVQRRLAVMAVDPANESQGKFLKAIETLGMAIVPIPWTQAVLSNPTDPEWAFQKDVAFQSASPAIAYSLGMIAERSGANVLVVSSSYDLIVPLHDLVGRRGRRAAIVYFRRFMDARWEREGLFEGGYPIGFFDLTPHAEDLLGLRLDAGSAPMPSGFGALE